MSNTNHNVINYESTFNMFCTKCKCSWDELYYKAFKLKVEYLIESNIEIVNRIIPCITDEEAIIKELLE